MKWTKMDNQTQVYMYWEYCATVPDYDEEPISFSEFDEMMRETLG